MTYEITRQIGIDAGHRVTTHGSKCKNVHGHRYTIEATCVADVLIPDGEQQGMVLDFGFLKEEMMDHIDRPCDHGMILWVEDPLLDVFVPQGFRGSIKHDIKKHNLASLLVDSDLTLIGKLYVVPFVPTAEHLAEHWFDLLKPRVHERSSGAAYLHSITVWETPNCRARYEPKRDSYTKRHSIHDR